MHGNRSDVLQIGKSRRESKLDRGFFNFCVTQLWIGYDATGGKGGARADLLQNDAVTIHIDDKIGALGWCQRDHFDIFGTADSAILRN